MEQSVSYTMAQQRLEENKDNPMVQGILRFVTDALQRTPQDISDWSIEVSDSEYRSFTVKFDGGSTGWKGYIANYGDRWEISRYWAFATVTGFMPTVTTNTSSVLSANEQAHTKRIQQLKEDLRYLLDHMDEHDIKDVFAGVLNIAWHETSKLLDESKEG